ncbi:MAG: hypothetical protein U0359_34860 [Byssovorax sp.]
MSVRGGAIVATGALAGLLAIPAEARAGAFELFGFGPEGAAQISARSARAEGPSAAFDNPAGLAFGSGTQLALAPTFGVSALSAQGQVKPLADPLGATLGLTLPLPIDASFARRIRLGLGAYFPTTVLRFIAHPGTEPFFPYYDNRSQRIVVLPALAVKITGRLALGAALNVLGGVTGPATVLPGASGAPESRIALSATTTAAVHVGLRFDPTERVHLALVFRQRFALPAAVSTRADVAGVPIDVDVSTASALYDPLTVVLGSRVDLGASTFELDASYVRWSDWEGPFAAVQASLPGVSLGSTLRAHPGRDVVSLRASATHRITLGSKADLELSGGAGAEPSMLASAPQGRTNMVDGDKLLFGLGASIVLREPFASTMDHAPATVRALRFGAGAGAQVLLPYAEDKRVCQRYPCPADTIAGSDPDHPGAGIDNPGFPRLTGGGSFWSISVGLGAEL